MNRLETTAWDPAFSIDLRRWINERQLLGSRFPSQSRVIYEGAEMKEGEEAEAEAEEEASSRG